MKNILLALLLIFSHAVTAQSPIQNFILVNVLDGTTVSLDSYTTAGVAIIFKSNACAYDGYYIERIKNMKLAYQGRIQFLLINSFQEGEESNDKMKAAYANWSLDIPYLSDKDQIALNSLGAKKSPEVFLLKRVNGKYTAVYSGAIDDNPQMATAVTHAYLKIAIDNLLAGQKIEVPAVRAVGCSIRKK